MTERKKLVKKLDKVFSEYIRLRDGQCVLCGSTENLQAGHLITRASYSTRWDEMNCFCQCRGCNLRHEYHPEIFTLWYVKNFGEDTYDDLVRKSKAIVKYSNGALKSLIEVYKKKVKELKEIRGV